MKMKKIWLVILLFTGMALGSDARQDNFIKAVELACERGDMDKCDRVAFIYDLNGEFKKSENIYIKACDGGSTWGCYGLGKLYKYGNGVEKDHLRAKRLFTKACDGGYALGCLVLGREYENYENNEGVMQNHFKAVEFYTRACDIEDDLGCYDLGRMYEDGKGVKQDYLKSIELYTKSCDGGDAEGCLKLGAIYEDGKGVMRNILKAKEFYGKACDRKNANGCKNYARLNKMPLVKKTRVITCRIKGENQDIQFSQSNDGKTIYMLNNTGKPIHAYIKRKSQGGHYRFYGQKDSIYVYDNRREISVRSHNSTTGEAGNIFAVLKCDKRINK